MEQIGRIFPSAFKTQILREEELANLLASVWPMIAGRLMAAHSRPISFASGTLILWSDCPSWTAQLGGLSEEIRAEVNRFLGEPRVERLLVRYAPDTLERRAAELKGKD